MCGIAGLATGSGDVVRKHTHSVLEALRHRGPDNSGQVKLSAGNREVWLGHTRLAIQDLSEAGAQPMRSQDGRWWISFNGEIYNHLDLRQQLSRCWRGHSDTETLVEAISEWGVEPTLKRLNGIFAFAVVDQSEQRLHVARDPFGVKPVHYYHEDGRFAFASEIRALAALEGRRFAIDRESLQTFLSLRFVPSPHTLLTGLMRLPAGHVLSYSIVRDETESHCYTRPVSAVYSGTFDDAVHAYQQRMRAAVRRQLLSDLPVGVLLSGGIDSALVAAMTMESGICAPCFTVGYEMSTSACEIDDAARTAEVLGLPHHVVRVTDDQLWQALELAINATEEPLATTSVLPMWHLCERARKDVTVVLTGQGSDELLGGYRRYQAELYRRIPMFSIIARTIAPLVARLSGVSDALERTLQSVAIADMAQRFESEYSVFDPQYRESIVGDSGAGRAVSAIQRWLDWTRSGRELSPVEQMMAIDVRLGLADDLLLYGDKVSMAHSLEARVPLLDTELVAFLESLPRAFKIGWNNSKVIHKRMAAQYLPASIVNRPKKGFQVPFGSMIRGSWKRRCQEMLFDRDVLPRLGLRNNAIERVWLEHQRGFRDRSRKLFALLGLSVWARGLERIIE